MKQRPSIYSFKAYRPFLRAAFEHRRSVDRKFSLAWFSGRIGHSSAYLKLVLSGKRELTLDSAALLGKVLQLDALERSYLINLALRESAATPALRTYAANQLVYLKREGMDYQPAGKLISVFENSLTWELFSLVGVEGFEPTSKWILPRLRRRDKSATKIALALRQLESLGAIRKEDGRFRANDVVIKHSFDVSRIYEVAAERLLEQLRDKPGDSGAYYDSFCLILGDDEYEQIRMLLEETKVKLGQIAREKNAPKTKIAYYNASLFRASE